MPMLIISENDKIWVEQILKKTQVKLNHTVDEIETLFPYTTVAGKYEKTVDDLPADGISWWTNGFWPGIMWLEYIQTGNEKFKNKAIECEKALDRAFDNYYDLHHDVGFMWLTSAVAHYQITGDETAKKRGLRAADMLAARYNSVGGFIRAWNGEDRKGIAIIDCMMNINLLYWASRETDDARYRFVAEKHAEKTMKHHVREDYSVNHIVRFDENTGEFIETIGGQGYGVGSSWSRGQAWALYGFILSYIHSGKKEFLNTAKSVANYFISNICDEYVAKCDFRSPKEPVIYDSTAGVIAACGLIEIAKAVDEFEKDMYLSAAIKILRATEEKFCDWSSEEQSIVQMGTGSYRDMMHIPIIYGDYYFIEALMKLNGNEVLFW